MKTTFTKLMDGKPETDKRLGRYVLVAMLALTVLFTVLKLTDVIGWSWLFVTMPLWGLPEAIVQALAVVITVILVRRQV